MCIETYHEAFHVKCLLLLILAEDDMFTNFGEPPPYKIS